jgi:hypothetical protein
VPKQERAMTEAELAARILDDIATKVRTEPSLFDADGKPLSDWGAGWESMRVAVLAILKQSRAGLVVTGPRAALTQRPVAPGIRTADARTIGLDTPRR